MVVTFAKAFSSGEKGVAGDILFPGEGEVVTVGGGLGVEAVNDAALAPSIEAQSILVDLGRAALKVRRLGHGHLSSNSVSEKVGCGARMAKSVEFTDCNSQL